MFLGEAGLPMTPEQARPDVPALLDGIREMDVPAQFIALTPVGRGISGGAYKFPREITAEDFDSLIDFAADPDASPSLLVRAQALELAIDKMSYSLYMQRRDGQEPDPELLKRCTEVEELIPDAFSEQAYHASVNGGYGGHASWLRGFSQILLQEEGIPKDYVFPEWHDFSFDPLYESNANPVHAFMLLDRLDKRTSDHEEVPMNRLARLIPLAFHIQDKVQGSDISFEVSERADLERRAKLSRLIDFGDDHRQEIEGFLHTNDPEINMYVDQLNELYTAADRLKDVFPASLAEAVSRGARELVASSIFALHAHFQNGQHSKVKLPLNNQAEVLPLELTGSEPYSILRNLTEAMKMLSDINNSANLSVTAVTQSTDYRLYRMMDVISGKQVSVYIRPQGGYSYDPAIEYGRSREGVEASISFVVDPVKRPGELLEVGKHRGYHSDNRISIRLDREGIEPDLRGNHDAKRDPVQEQGTLSLDVGSIIGNDNWMSTKIGRFLAWGNTLRSQQRGEHAGLNHVTHYFTEEQGRADVFAEQARNLVWSLEVQRRTADDLLLGAGNLALQRAK